MESCSLFVRKTANHHESMIQTKLALENPSGYACKEYVVATSTALTRPISFFSWTILCAEDGTSEKHTGTLYGILGVKMAWNELIWHVCPGNHSTQHCWRHAQQRMCQEGHPGKTHHRSIGRPCQALLLLRSSLGWQEGGKLKSD